MQKRHSDPLQYLNEQIVSTEKYVVPYIHAVKPIRQGMQVLEIGCGEGGNLKPFLDRGCICTGVDFSTPKIEKGRHYYSTHEYASNITLISEDIYKTNDFHARFDLIIVRDVIEHIHDQDRFLSMMKALLAADGIAFFAFPPWQNPFGGHQQICVNKLASSMPYYHLLPKSLYKGILKMLGESTGKIDGLLEIKETGISIERFEKLCRKNDYKLLKRTWYLINPNYEIKFGLKPRLLPAFLGWVPCFRNFVTTCGYYIITLN